MHNNDDGSESEAYYVIGMGIIKDGTWAMVPLNKKWGPIVLEEDRHCAEREYTPALRAALTIKNLLSISRALENNKFGKDLISDIKNSSEIHIDYKDGQITV